jgi:hypothetical protein
MKDILIYTEDILPKAKYMNDLEGRHDLLGQLLFTGFGIRIPAKTRTPQDLDKSIRHFVVCVRGYCYCNTPLTLSLLELTPLPGKRQVAEANKLLNPIGINLVVATDDKPTPPPKIEGVVFTPTYSKKNLSLTNLERTSWYTCTCGNNTVVSTLKKYNLACPVCLDPLDDTFIEQIKLKFG